MSTITLAHDDTPTGYSATIDHDGQRTTHTVDGNVRSLDNLLRPLGLSRNLKGVRVNGYGASTTWTVRTVR